MAVSKLTPASNANDFNLNITGFYTKITLNKEYPSGSYSLTSGNNDTSLDIYAFNSDGSSAGVTATKSFTATKGFNKLVVVGGQTGDVLSFAFKTTYPTETAGAETGVPPIPTGATPTSLPLVDDTTTLSGYNFASGMTVKFIGTDSVVRNAKSTIVGSSTSAIVTRPDVLPVSTAPYDISIEYAGITPPVGSTAGILENAITVGAGPTWTTSATLPVFTMGTAYSTTVLATDPDPAGSISSYSITAGALPTGLSLASSTGVISGTPTSSGPATVTIRATNQDGDYVDRQFTMTNAGPTWVTASGNLTEGVQGSVYSTTTLVATDDSGAAPTYALAAGSSLPTGLSLSSSGVISGTVSGSATATTFTVTASDANGTGTNRSFTIPVVVANAWNLVATVSMMDLSEGYYGFDGSRYVYYGAGQPRSGGTFPTTFQRYDMQTNAITSLADGPQRDEVGSVFLNGNLYVLGGAVQNGTQQTAVWRYSVSGNSWSNIAGFSEAFYNSHCGTDGTNIYFVPASTSYNKNMVRYNVSAGTFTILAQTSANSDNLASLTPKMAYDPVANVFYTTGYNAANAQERLYRYNVAANSWTVLGGTIPKTYGDQIWTGGANYAYGFEYLASRNALYIFHWDAAAALSTGVTRSAGTPDKVIRFDLSTNTWSLVNGSDNINVGVGGASWSYNNALYCLGGYTNLGAGQVHQYKAFKLLPT